MTFAEPLSTDSVSLLNLISRSDFPSRIEYLSLACHLVNSEQCVALLWLYDRILDQYVLDRIFDAYSSGEEPASLYRIYADREIPTNGDSRSAPTGAEIALEYHPKILEWCKKKREGFAPREHRFLIPGDSQGESHLGFLQLLVSKDCDLRDLSIVNYLVNNLARVIIRKREIRRLKALEQMNALIDLSRPINEWLQLAADTLREMTSAEICLVFQQAPDLQFRAVTVSPSTVPVDALYASSDGLISKVAQDCRAVSRIRDYRDRIERLEVFDTEEYDEVLASKISDYLHEDTGSRMMACVLVGRHPFAVIKLANKTKYLARQFSEADEKAVETVCNFLAGVIPSVETYRSMVQISETAFPSSLEEETGRAALFSLLTERIPGVAGACLYVYLGDNSTAPLEARVLGGEEWCDEIAPPRMPIGSKNAPSHWQLGAVSRLPQTTIGNRFLYVQQIPSLERKKGYLALALNRSYLSDYEKQVVSFFSAELSQILRSDDAKRHLIEVRHAIRSGLEGLNHIHVAVQCFRRIQKLGFRPSTIDRAQFRKALERSSLFAKKTHILMEESRFLMGGVSPQSLRIANHSLSALINDVQMCLNHAAV